MPAADIFQFAVNKWIGFPILTRFTPASTYLHIRSGVTSSGFTSMVTSLHPVTGSCAKISDICWEGIHDGVPPPIYMVSTGSVISHFSGSPIPV